MESTIESDLLEIRSWSQPKGLSRLQDLNGRILGYEGPITTLTALGDFVRRVVSGLRYRWLLCPLMLGMIRADGVTVC